MERRTFLRYGIASISALVLTGTEALAQFGMKKKLGGGGGGGGADWKSIVADFNGGLVEFGKQAGAIGNVISDLAAALNLKQQAATMRGEAENTSGKGDALGTGDLDSFNATADSTLELIEDKLKDTESLTADQKKKMAEAASKYVPALVAGVQAGAQLAKAASNASKAGTPGFGDGMAIIKVAKNIPTLTPKAIGFMTNSVKAGQKVFAIMRESGVAVPAMDIDMSEMNI